VVAFNPNKYTINKGISWTVPGGKASEGSAEQTNSTQNAQPLTFSGGQSRSISLDLLFDSTEATTDRDRDVRNQIKRIVGLGRIIRDLKPPRPPVCEISWGPAPQKGSDFPFTGVLAKLNETFTLFADNGTPLRVNLTLEFTEWLDPKADALQNDPEFTTRLCKRGDSLSSIAAETYSDPTQWRVIAEANALDDPRNIPIGMRLNIPKIR
jgi:nucleoid-associated protein YgaU